MTLLIGLHLQSYIIIAADTRVTIKPFWGGELYQDGDHKIALCKFGLVTGSGEVEALGIFKKELMNTEISNTDEFMDLIQKKTLPYIHSPDSNTCFLVSYMTGNEDGTEPKLRLCLMHPNWDYKLGLSEDVFVVCPSDTNLDYLDLMKNFLKENMCLYDIEQFKNNDISLLVNNFYYNSNLIAQCLKKTSELSKQVSSDMDIAAHLFSGETLYFHCESDDIIKGNINKMFLIKSRDKVCFLSSSNVLNLDFDQLQLNITKNK